MARIAEVPAQLAAFDSHVLAGAAGGDLALASSLIGEALASLRSQVNLLAADTPQWRDQVHRFKGLAATLGALRVARVASHAEGCTDPGSRADWLDLLHREMAVLERELL